MTQDLSQQLWAQYTSQIASQMGAGAGSANIQVLPSAQLLYGKKEEITTAIQRFAALVPQWGAVYNPSTSTVMDAYQTILTQIQETATNGTSIEAKFTKQNNLLTTMMGSASDYYIAKMQKWQDVVKNYTGAGLQAPSFIDWFKDNGQQEYKTMLDKQAEQMDVVEMLIRAEGIASPLVEALADLNKTMQKSKTDKTSMPLTFIPDVSLLADWVKQPTNPQTIAFTDTSTQYDYSQTIWQSQSGIKLFGFISIGHRSSSSTQTNIFNSSTQYGIQIDFAAQASFNIAQGEWFNGALLKNYKSGPWVVGSQFANVASHPYSDADAIFPLLVTRIFVVLNPTITITQQKNESNQLFSQLNDQYANGVNLGGFAFGGSESSSSNIKQHTTTDADTMQIVITDTSNVPQIIAVANELMP